MKKISCLCFILIICLTLFKSWNVIAENSNVNNTMISFSYTFPTTGWGSGKHTFVNAPRNVSSFSSTIWYKNTSGINKGSIGNNGTSVHDYKVYIYDSTDSYIAITTRSSFDVKSDNEEYIRYLIDIYMTDEYLIIKGQKYYGDTWGDTIYAQVDATYGG